jgi:hypothetical protein
MNIKSKYITYVLKNDPNQLERFGVELVDEYRLVQYYLNSMLPSMKDWILDGINAVLTDKSECEVRDGEIYGIEIRKDKTRVYDIFSEEEEKVIECYIETVELKKLILAWIEELEKNKIIR